MLTGIRWFLPSDYGLTCLTNIAFGPTALVLDISGETN